MKNLSFDDLKDKCCVLTGGAGVIGTAIAYGLGQVGIKTAIVDINKEMAEKVADQVQKKTGTVAKGFVANVLDRNSLLEAKKAINKEFGPVDFLINGAGGNSPKATTQLEKIEKENLNELEKTFFGLEMDGFDWVYNLNFKGTLLPTMVFATDMLQQQRGSIINISSMNSFRPLTKIPAYSAAKASINNLTQWLSVHLAKTGVRVNAVAPGFFLTNQNRFLLVDENTGKATPRGEKIIASTPMGKYGEPEDLQGTILFLLSGISEFITGIVVPVDGGYSAYGGV
jgi:NAD(P)-dependent dehydrogenase (short-subunit alcohol dehydrogenase family)